jgi:hypothetical protein
MHDRERDAPLTALSMARAFRPGDEDLAPAALLVAEVHHDPASLFRMAGQHLPVRWPSPNRACVIDAPLSCISLCTKMFTYGQT